MSTENNNIFDEDFDLFSDIADNLAYRQVDSQNKSKETEDDIEDDIDASLEYKNSNTDEDQEDKNLGGDENQDSDHDGDNEDNKDIEEDTSSQDTKASPFTPYAKFLVEEGILSNLDLENFDGTADSLKEAQLFEINSGIEGYKNSLPPEVRYLVDNYEAGVPFDKILNMSSKQIQYESIQDDSLGENEDLQKELVREYFKKTTKLSDDKIERQISRLSDLSELEDEAKSSLKELIELQKEDVEIEKQRAIEYRNSMIEAQKREVENLDKYLNDTDEIIPNIKIPKQIKDKIKKNLTTPVAKDDNGNLINKVGLYRANNPVKFEVILNYLYEATNEFKDWGVLGKAGKRSALKEFEDAARSIDSRSASSSSNGQSSISKNGGKGLMDAISGLTF